MRTASKIILVSMLLLAQVACGGGGSGDSSPSSPMGVESSSAATEADVSGVQTPEDTRDEVAVSEPEEDIPDQEDSTQSESLDEEVNEASEDASDEGEEAPEAEEVFNLTLMLGYTESVTANRITFTHYIHGTEYYWLQKEEFARLGRLFSQWMGATPMETYSEPVWIGGHSEKYEMNVEVIVAQTDDEFEYWCDESAAACTHHKKYPFCRIVLREDFYDALLGHELWHCVAGSWHS